MASTDPLDEVLSIINENISFLQKATKLASVKWLCERAIIEESRKNEDKKVFVCDFSHLQFPQSEQEPLFKSPSCQVSLMNNI